ncbi:hypothetical protein [Bythopirellula polymerisocia]|uniref:Uncharacterized protein n=1 Tax=Bythopirellula polymerisocia TaxID=2528003 RepID=A0A5C6CYR7_9BACT|nr:hypothetical protein [Bythopirellula polymerisocia]TWU28621.1 hypothetical protein Pla144_19130 [Bythopirellula polymerisocia]
MMTDSSYRPIQPPKYLPGQRSLFPEDLEFEIDSGTELFYTGKDLPGAKETSQVILWDVDSTTTAREA